MDRHIATNCLIHAQFYSFKDSTKRINNLKAFSQSVKLEIQQNTSGLLTMSRSSSTIFQKVRMAAFVHSLCVCVCVCGGVGGRGGWDVGHVCGCVCYEKRV